MRRGHRDDLSRVRRIADDLLVARHGRVEDGLAECLPHRAEGVSAEDRAVLEREQRRGALPHLWRHRCAFPSATTRSPRYSVWITRPRRVVPRKALFRLFDVKGGSTTHSAPGSNATRVAGRPGSIGPP